MENISKNEKKKTITDIRLTSPWTWLIWLIICIAANCLSDIYVVFTLVAGKIDLTYIIFPIVLLALDIIVLGVAIISNFRFKNSLFFPVIYVVVTVFITIFIATWYYVVLGQVLFSDGAIILWLITQVLSCVALLFAVICASGRGKLLRIITGFLSIIFITCVGFYIYSIITHGFFGQGSNGFFDSHATRNLVYVYNSEGDYYEVTDVIAGSGDTIIIPEEFNNKKVGAINCSIFADNTLNIVKLQCNENVVFNSKEELGSKNSNIKVYADRNSIDRYRRQFYDIALNTPVGNPHQYVDFANSIYPEIMDNEVYITFDYSLESLEISNGQILNTWIAPSGSTFDINNYANGVTYLDHCDLLSEYDLCWNYHNMNGRIFTALADINGESIEGKNIEASKSMRAVFEPIYAISFGEDNDDLFDIEHSETSFNFNGTDMGYRYVTARTAQSFLSSIGKRNGFKISWQYSSMGSVSKSDFSNLDETILSDKMVLYPMWALEPPIIESLTTDADNDTIIYGENIKISSVVSAPIGGILLRYEWLFGGSIAGETSDLDLHNVHPSQAGDYTVKVTAYSNNLTSLTSVSEDSIPIKVGKKLIHFNWGIPEDLIYSATDKTVSCNYVDADVINSDKITFELSQNKFRNVGTYNLHISLTGECNNLYVIDQSDQTNSITITPRHLTVTWGKTSFTYNGLEQAPEPIVSALSDDELGKSISGHIRNVGAGVAQIDISNSNYVIDNPTVAFNILPKEVTLSWQDNTTFEYNGLTKSLTASVIGLVPGEVVSLSYSGEAVNAGQHEMHATLPINSNYKLADGEGSCSFTITQKPVTLSWSTIKSFTYDGTSKGLTATINGLVFGDKVNLKYSGEKISVGSWEMQASLPEGSNYKFDETETGKCGYTINQRELTISADNKQKTYDGETFSAFTCTYFGLASTDTLDQVATITYSGTAVEAINFGKYPILVGTTHGDKYNNYNVNIISGELQITQKPVTLNWQVDRTFTYDGTLKSIAVVGINGLVKEESLSIASYDGAEIAAGTHTMIAYLPEGCNYMLLDDENSCQYTINKRPLSLMADDASKIYDGKTYTGFSFKHDGLASTDSIPEVVTVKFAGNAVQAVNVGTNYTISLDVIKGEKYANYIVSTVPAILTISSRPVDLSWENSSSYTYDGKPKTPTASTSDLISDDGAYLVYSYYGISSQITQAAPINVGSYRVVVSVESENYDLSNTNCSANFTIVAKTVTLAWENSSSYTYDGKPKTPTASTSDLISDDGAYLVYTYYDVSSQIIQAAPINVGSYRVVVSVESENYNLSNTNYSANFTIVAKTVTLTWENSSPYIYDGTPKTPSASTHDLISGDGANLKFTYYSKDDGEIYLGVDAPVNVGHYKVEVSIEGNNYNLSGTKVEEDFQIEQATVTFSWDTNEEIYTGTAIRHEAEIHGLITKDIGNIQVYYEYYDSENRKLEEAPTDPGEYKVKIVGISSDNYVLSGILEDVFTIIKL